MIDLDVTDDAFVASGVHEILTKADMIDVVINNAGVLYAGISEVFSVEQVKAQ